MTAQDASYPGQDDWNEWVPLRGSKRAKVPPTDLADAGPGNELDPERRIRVTVLLAPDPDPALQKHRDALRARAQGEIAPGRREPYASREEVISANWPSADALLKLGTFAGKFGLAVGPMRPPGLLTLEGRTADVRAAFRIDSIDGHRQAVESRNYPVDFRQRTGPILVPKAIADVVEAVLGTDDRRQARIKMHIKMHTNVRPSQQAPADGGRSGTLGIDEYGEESYTPRNLAALYGFPQGLDGRGQTIAILSQGGALDLNAVGTYFKYRGAPTPPVTQVVVDDPPDRLGVEPLADDENQLDFQVAASIAPGAHFLMYQGQNTSAGCLATLAAAVYDPVNRPTVITWSWGLAEAFWTDMARCAIDRVLQDAASMGVTVCVASGDHGSWDDPVDQSERRLDFPAGSPYALVCGGTQFDHHDGQRENAQREEVVWDETWPRNGTPGKSKRYASGGGESACSERPPWQDGILVRETAGGKESPPEHRAAPDLAACADPGCVLRFEGSSPYPDEQEQKVAGGTSFAAPFCAAMVALFNQELERPVGFITPFLYTSVDHDLAFEDIKRGNNGDYMARDGWDACTGWGRARGQWLLDQLR
jgi:kumamolisin